MRYCPRLLGRLRCRLWCNLSRSSLLVARVAANLLALAAVASLDDSHEVSVVALLLGL